MRVLTREEVVKMFQNDLEGKQEPIVADGAIEINLVINVLTDMVSEEQDESRRETLRGYLGMYAVAREAMQQHQVRARRHLAN